MVIEDPNRYKEFNIESRNGKYGIIDTMTEEVVVDFVFNEIKWLWFSTSLSLENRDQKCVACLRLGTRWGIVPYHKLHELKKP